MRANGVNRSEARERRSVGERGTQGKGHRERTKEEEGEEEPTTAKYEWTGHSETPYSVCRF